MDALDPVSALVGGAATSFIGSYMGIESPILNIMSISLGAYITSKSKKYYDEFKHLVPGCTIANNCADKVLSKLGLKYYTIIITKNENVIFNKIQTYILHKYETNLTKGEISKVDNIKVSLTLENSEFSKPIIDEYKKCKIILSVQNSTIEIRSKNLNIEQLKEYVKHLLTLHFGTKIMSVHQPIIEKEESKSGKETRTNVYWKTFQIQTNKTLKNTILSKNVEENLLKDVDEFINNEEYYNTKGIPYKRGYLLYGEPGTGKTSIIKSIASHYCMDIYLINMGEIKDEKDLTLLFQGTRSCQGYHILCFEDIDRCKFLIKTRWGDGGDGNRVRTFINEIDGIVEIPKRLTFFTANNKKILDDWPALIRPGRIDKAVQLDYCDADQVNRLYNHYTNCSNKLLLDNLCMNITPAQVVKHVLTNPDMSPDKFKDELGVVKDIIVQEQKQSKVKTQNRKMDDQIKKKRRMISRIKRNLKCDVKSLESLPKKIEKAKISLEKNEGQLKTLMERKKRKREKEKKNKNKNIKNKAKKTKVLINF